MVQLYIQDSSVTPRKFPIFLPESALSKGIGQVEPHSTTSHNSADFNSQAVRAFVPVDALEVPTDQPNLEYVAVDFYTSLNSQALYQRQAWRFNRTGLTVSVIGLNDTNIASADHSTMPTIENPVFVDIPVLVDTSNDEVFAYIPKGGNNIDEDNDTGPVYNAYGYTSTLGSPAYERSVSVTKVSLGIIVPPVKIIVE